MPLLHVDIGSVLAGVLMSLRLGVVLFMTPLLGGASLPARVRVLAVFSLCLWLALGLHPPLAGAADALQSLPAFFMALLSEALWGLLLGFGLSSAFAAFHLGGRALELQMGLGMAALFDPASHTQQPLMGGLLQMAGVASFLALDGHHMVLRGLAASLQSVPLGASPLTVPPLAVLEQFGLAFSLGLMLVAAPMACVLLVDIGMSVMSRLLPQANVFLLSVPVKILAGLVMLALTLPLLRPLLARLYLSAFRYWDSLLAS